MRYRCTWNGGTRGLTTLLPSNQALLLISNLVPSPGPLIRSLVVELIACSVPAPGYIWEQNSGSITFKFEVEPDLAVVDIDVRITATELRAAVSGVQGFRICGSLHQQISESGSTWRLDQKKGYGVVTIELEKAISMSWAFPIKVQSVMLQDIRELELGKHYEGIRDFKNAMRLVERSALHGNAEAQLQLGKLYHLGNQTQYPTVTNVAAAVKYYHLAAAQNCGEAKFLLALAFQEGNGVPKKLATAIEWYKAVVHAEQQTIDIAMSRFQSGDESVPFHTLTALFNLGVIFQSGDAEVPVNFEESIKWWKMAADLNFPPAIFNLGVMYMEGKGTPRDMAKAREYFQRAERLNPKLRMPEHLSTRQAARAPAVSNVPPAAPAMASRTDIASSASSASSSRAVGQQAVSAPAASAARPNTTDADWMPIITGAVVLVAVLLVRLWK